MTLEELWNLFPITFVVANVNFNNIYLEEEHDLKLLLGNSIKRINHM